MYLPLELCSESLIILSDEARCTGLTYGHSSDSLLEEPVRAELPMSDSTCAAVVPLLTSYL